MPLSLKNKPSSQYRREAVILWLCCILILGTLAPAVAEPPKGSRLLGGNLAIKYLGKFLPAVAKRNRLSAVQLRKILRTDRTLRVSPGKGYDARLVYVDPAIEFQAQENDSGDSPSSSALVSTDVFTLHSKPGSPRTIFLDLDGHVITNSVWNLPNWYPNVGSSYTAGPFDTDFPANPAVFSANELSQILSIWKRVAEDYAPFDVDVTTEDPGIEALQRISDSDSIYGTRALLTTDPGLSDAVCDNQCGGIAWVGFFNFIGPNPNTYYQPTLVFPQLNGGNEKFIAAATSHEVGHMGGLHHDGTSTTSYYAGHGSGETGWAPIMGRGQVYNVTQWSMGEYPDANNQEDDFAVLASKGISFRADDHGDIYTSSTALGVGSSLMAEGIIEQRTDKDFFSFNAGVGDVTISSLPVFGTNLDLKFWVYSSSGVVLGSANPPDLLSASLSFAAAYEGTYFLRVDGVGYGDLVTGYSDYASLGQYALAITVDNPANMPPQANAGSNITSGTAPQRVTFSSAGSFDSDGTIVTYDWDFGDGSSSSSTNPSHMYTSAGNFTASLTLTDNDGATNTDQIPIIINQPPLDLTPPTVRIDGPANGATFQTTPHLALVISGSGFDSGRLSWMKFKLNGTVIKTCRYNNFPFNAVCSHGIAVNQLSIGANTLSLVASDFAGNTASHNITLNRT